MRFLRSFVFSVGLILGIGANANASPLGNTYKLYADEASALKALKGTSRHVLILFSDYTS
jgi:hypothetical protein